MPDAKATPEALPADSAELQERAEALDRASRDYDNRGVDTSINPAPDFWTLPAKDYSFTSTFGQRWGKAHEGVDLAKAEGSKIVAAHGGTVKLASWNGGYGNCVIIDHGNGVETLYGHASRLLVKPGQQVNAGTPIALMGNTGYSFGAHLHFEVHVNGRPTDPVPFLKGRGVDIPRGVETLDGNILG
jgi:murein DD-endopeptidase MepM/ murein hydrolase activator NlpD